MMHRPQSRSLSAGSFGLWLISLLLFALVARAEANVPPEQMLQSVSDKMFKVMEREREALKQEPTKLFALVEEVLLPHVDMEVMSRFVLGKHWRTASATQRERFTEEFKNLLIRFYVSALVENPEKIDELLSSTEGLITYLPSNIEAGARKTSVRAEVKMPNGGPKVPVVFSLFLKEGQWLLYDVNVDGISLVTNYRSSFSTEVSRQGLDTLIERLAKRNQELLEKAENGQAEASAGQ
ncbi:MAG: ABC transporter substrate-binding protein [Gammaproteobacteria bacterium]|nr:ABC transporter substrate-binding protein [Gammaproteobacteria bacterium]